MVPCPLWIICGDDVVKSRRLLYPRKVASLLVALLWRRKRAGNRRHLVSKKEAAVRRPPQNSDLFQDRLSCSKSLLRSALTPLRQITHETKAAGEERQRSGKRRRSSKHWSAKGNAATAQEIRKIGTALYIEGIALNIELRRFRVICQRQTVLNCPSGTRAADTETVEIARKQLRKSLPNKLPLNVNDTKSLLPIYFYFRQRSPTRNRASARQLLKHPHRSA